ncbi:MAG: nucleotidyltransferase domain-containing protein [Caldivirga sp.]
MRLIILFGSRARGDFTENSDFDVLIVGDEVPIDPRKVSDELYMWVVRMFRGAVDPIFMNTEVFLRKLKDGVPFILQAIEEGVVIYREVGFWREVMGIYSSIRPLYERRGKDWVRVK